LRTAASDASSPPRNTLDTFALPRAPRAGKSARVTEARSQTLTSGIIKMNHTLAIVVVIQARAGARARGEDA
jgi:hypothetical protein